MVWTDLNKSLKWIEQNLRGNVVNMKGWALSFNGLSFNSLRADLCLWNISYLPPQLSLLSHHTLHQSLHWYTYCPLTAVSFLLIDPLLWQPYAALMLYPFLISLRHQLVIVTCQSCILDRILTSVPGAEWRKAEERVIEGEKYGEENKIEANDWKQQYKQADIWVQAVGEEARIESGSVEVKRLRKASMLL